MATMKLGRAATFSSELAAAAIGCAGKTTVDTAACADAAGAVYVVELHPLNAGIAGNDTNGKARITVRGDVLTITIHVRSAPPDIEHWQHFHGFKDGRVATCPRLLQTSIMTAQSTSSKRKLRPDDDGTL